MVLCPECKCQSVVVDSGPMNGTTRRRRKCPQCGKRWYTWELTRDILLRLAEVEAALAQAKKLVGGRMKKLETLTDTLSNLER